MAEITSSVPTYLGDETYHMRHPLHPVQPLQTHRQSSVSETERRDQNLARRSQKEKNIALQSEINSIRDEIDKRVKTLMDNFPQKESFILGSVYNVSSFKPPRKINLWNAEVSYKAKELRENGEVGGLQQARTEVMKLRELRNGKALPQEESAAIMKHAHERRTLREYGARPTNRSAAKDAIDTVTRVESELKRLSSRTGTAAVFIAGRGHINDIINPVAFETNNASGFCKKVLGHALSDVGGRLEAFNVMNSKESQSVHSTRDLRKRCVSIIIDGLREITGRGEIAMNYQNYETTIVSRYQVQLVGWPSHIPFANPSNVKTEDLQRLYNALQSLECRWQKMSRDEIASHNAHYDIRVAEASGRKRKERSDKGKKRVSNKDATKRQKAIDSSVRPVPRGKRLNTSRQFPPSAEFIDTDSDEGHGSSTGTAD